jgi:hypothetical protein
LAEAEQPDAGDLAGEEAAGGNASKEDLDDAAGLLLDDAAEHERAVGRDRHEQQQGHDERRGLIVGGAPGDLAEFDVGNRDGREEFAELRGRDASGGSALLHRVDLDGGRDDGFELIVGSLGPFELDGVHDEHVDVAVAHRLFAFGDVVVAAHPGLGGDGVALRGDGGLEGGGRRPGEADVLGPAAGVDERGERDDADDGDDHHDERREEGARPATFPELTFGDEPSLAEPVHAATACWNSSDNVGGS